MPPGRRRRPRNTAGATTALDAVTSERGGAWTSALSVGELASIGSVGFEPVGQVMGSAVLRLKRTGRFWGYHDCGYPPPGGQPARPIGARSRAPVAVSGAGAASATVVEVFDRARRIVLERMSAQCRAIGGHGVVAAVVSTAPMDAEPECTEFTVIGTAVRARGSKLRLRTPFTSHLDGHGFAKLLAAGWVPVELLVGMSIGVRHDDSFSRVPRLSSRNTEISGLSQLVRTVRADARRQLQVHGAERGGNALITAADGTLRVWKELCTQSSGGDDELTFHDHLAESTLVGSTVARFEAPPRRTTLTVMPLGPRGGGPDGRVPPDGGADGDR
ncbi:heavy metal-binding domain-containing protein [Streptomyces sp. V4-01]|uniref:Heavy metal-binding domain-containing protein n=1 Tax=Actinacidiphila polyblastidii TaxID=3110430 RepID=A0ABU7PAA5_9ACTN|nr:heavy metal-binding domain-containing protein [Streptomyces sp. V4-01]